MPPGQLKLPPNDLKAELSIPVCWLAGNNLCWQEDNLIYLLPMNQLELKDPKPIVVTELPPNTDWAIYPGPACDLSGPRPEGHPAGGEAPDSQQRPTTPAHN